MSRVFLTGATGVVGSAVLLCLLEQGSDEIVVLIRKRGTTSSEERLLEILKFLEAQSITMGPSRLQSWKNRIQTIDGDLETERFGLNEDSFARLGQSLHHIIHSAASVDLTQAEADAMDSTLKATRTVLSLQEMNPDCVLQYVSTVGINGTRKMPLEECVLHENRTFFNTYEKAKAASEALIFSSIEAGKKIIVHRPSMVVGHSLSGRILHFQVFYYILKLLAGGRYWVVIPPILTRKLDTIPSDFVAQIIFESLNRNDLWGQVLHECSGPQLALRLSDIQATYFHQAQQLGVPRPRVLILPKIFFRALSLMHVFLPPTSKLKKKLQIIPQFLNYAGQDQIFLNTATQRAFPNLKWPDPKVYLLQSLKYYIEAKAKK